MKGTMYVGFVVENPSPGKEKQGHLSKVVHGPVFAVKKDESN